MREALARRGDIDVDVVAVLNDTVGTMMACAFHENTCNMGVIIGTGTNACYMEKLENIKKYESQESERGTKVVYLILILLFLDVHKYGMGWFWR